MAETYGIPSASLAKIQRMINAKRAAGVDVKPWELEAAFEAELDSLQKTRSANRSLDIQQQSLDETRRQNLVNEQLKADEISASKKASTLGAVGNLGVMAVLGQNAGLFGKDAATGEKKGIIDYTGDMLSKGVSKVRGIFGNTPTSTVTSTPSRLPLTDEAADIAFESGGGAGVNAGKQIATDTAGSGTALAPATQGGTATVSGNGMSTGTMIGTGLGGFTAGSIINKTGLGEKVSDISPVGGRREWNTLLGAGAGAGIGYLVGGPVGALIGGGGGAIGGWLDW